MQGDDTLSARSSVQRLRQPRPAGWMVLAFLALALALVVFVVRNQPTVLLPERATEWGEFLGQQGNLLLVLSVISIVVALWALRRFRFAQLARKPGPVEILQFSKGQDTEAPVENIIAHFRKSLRDVSLSPPMSMPGEPVSQDFMQVMRTATNEATGAIGAVIGMLSALQVNSSYRVSGVLRKRDESSRFGLTIHIVVLPNNTGAVKTFWADNWFMVAELGAHFVGSYVLPRSKICTQPPWTAWRGIAIPHELFHCYQVAQSMLRQERYEEALYWLFSALRMDPQNPYIRIQVAQLREQLGQHLDAVADYVDIMEIQAWQDRRLWNRLRRSGAGTSSRGRAEESGRPLVSLGSHRNDPEALLVTRYRLVSALVRGSRLADQWAERDLFLNPRRREERRILRDRLQKWLTPRYKEFGDSCTRQGGEDGLPDDVNEFARTCPELLPLLFHFVAFRETVDLIRDYSWSRGRRRPNMSVPQSALRVLEIWAALHLILVELRVSRGREVGAARCDDECVASIRKKLDLAGAGSDWPPDAEVLESLIKDALWWKPGGFRGWQEHYNSASVFAVNLLAEDVDAASKERIARKAVHCLERAVLTTGSGLASQYSKWLAFGDQDLNGLRGTDSFAHFDDRYFPRSELRKVNRPRDLLERVLSAHITGLVRRYAALRAEFWVSRIELPNDLLAAEEASRERDAALLVWDYIQDHWSWQVRLRLIKEGQRFVEGLEDEASFDSGFPSSDVIRAALIECADDSSRNALHGLTEGSGRVTLTQSTITLPEQIQVIEAGPLRIPGDTDHNGHGAGKDATLLSSLWRHVDDLLDTALREDDAMSAMESNLRQIIAVAKRPELPVGDSTEAPVVAPDPANPGSGSRRS